jgi:hypothetical protein
MIVANALSRRLDFKEEAPKEHKVVLNQLTTRMIDFTDYIQEYLKKGVLLSNERDSEFIKSRAYKFRFGNNTRQSNDTELQY